MTAGSARWYQICERLGRDPTYPLVSSSSLAVRLRADVNMADAGSPFAMATPHAGRKRGREDAEVEDEGVAQGLRFEKVCHDPHLTRLRATVTDDLPRKLVQQQAPAPTGSATPSSATRPSRNPPRNIRNTTATTNPL